MRSLPRHRAARVAGGVQVEVLREARAGAHVFVETATDAVSSMLRALLRVTSEEAALEVLHRTVRTLGGTVVPASSSGPDTLPIDLALGVGPPLVLAVEPFSVARMQLERLLPGLVEDTRQVLNLLRQRSRSVAER